MPRSRMRVRTVERHDFAKNLLYQFVALPIAWHPVQWLTHAHIVETREMVCDAMAADRVQGRESYAKSLLRLASILASGTQVRTIHAIGMFDANHFERRIMNPDREACAVDGWCKGCGWEHCVVRWPSACADGTRAARGCHGAGCAECRFRFLCSGKGLSCGQWGQCPDTDLQRGPGISQE